MLQLKQIFGVILAYVVYILWYKSVISIKWCTISDN